MKPRWNQRLMQKPYILCSHHKLGEAGSLTTFPSSLKVKGCSPFICKTELALMRPKDGEMAR